MPMTGQAQKVEELICQTGADDGHPRTEALLTLSLLEAIALSHRSGRCPGPYSIIPAGFKWLGIRGSSETCCRHLLGKVAPA